MSRDSLGGQWTAPELLTPDASARINSRWSPDGSKIAYSNVSARWSPDGSEIAYSSGSLDQVWIVPLQGEERLLFDGGAAGLFTLEWPVWSPDGRFIYFNLIDSTGTAGLYTIPVKGGALREVVNFVSRMPYTLGDGKAYFSVVEIESDIWVMDLEY